MNPEVVVGVKVTFDSYFSRWVHINFRTELYAYAYYRHISESPAVQRLVLAPSQQSFTEVRHRLPSRITEIAAGMTNQGLWFTFVDSRIAHDWLSCLLIWKLAPEDENGQWRLYVDLSVTQEDFHSCLGQMISTFHPLGTQTRPTTGGYQLFLPGHATHSERS